MSEVTGATAVRARLCGYLADILHPLPTGSALVLRHPELPDAAFHDGVTLPWNDSDTGASLVFADIAYWVLGPAPDAADDCFDAVLRRWQDRGLTPLRDRAARPRSGTVATADGYRLAVRQSVRGHLSVSGSTPPFPADPDAAEPFPDRIGPA
ncbi:hypothetical protein AB0H71_12325 [Nocardia sp. NPDC050697]|uniref:hypothetical protein n=1 Tax=Nocardia sp. NPDC050697 TaxID=3155158 RepID=UPI0033C44EF2